MSYSEKFEDEKDQNPIPEEATEKENRKMEETTDDLSINIGGPGPGQMSREEIEESLEQIINGIETKRRQDMKIVEDAVKEIMAQAKSCCEAIEQNLLHMHTMKSKELDEELKKLVGVLDNIKRAEVELETSRTSLNTLCQEIQKSLM